MGCERKWLSHRTPLARGHALAGVAVGFGGFFVSAGWLIGPELANQFSELGDRLPEAIASIESWVRTHPLGDKLLASSSNSKLLSTSNIWSGVSTTLGALGEIIVLLAVGWSAGWLR